MLRWIGVRTAVLDKPGRPTADLSSSVRRRLLVLPGRTTAFQPSLRAFGLAAYRLSVKAGNPLSERKLANLFGRTCRRWA
jgi:hypothetical protein